MSFEGKIEGQPLKRRPTRITVRYDAMVRCDAGEIPAQILDISAEGFRLRSRHRLEAGWTVSVEVPKREPVRAMIRWARGHEAGGVFLERVAL